MSGRATLIAIGAVVIALVCNGCSAPVPPNAGITINTNTQPGLRAKQTLDMLNADQPIESSGISLLAAANDVQSVQAGIENLWLDRPFTVSGVDYFVGHVVMHLLNSFGAGQNLEIHTDDAGLVDRLGVELVPPVINSWADVDAALMKSGARYSYQVAKVTDGRCERIAGANIGEALPLASIFKLYVLDAVSDGIKAGTVKWDDPLTVTTRARAVDFSPLDEFPPGSTISVRIAAEKMIAISSNMATDLLIDRIGTAAVEHALVAAGHHDPQSMTPFPTMHDLFSIGWGLPDLRQQWKDAVASGSPQARARLLDQASSAPYQPDPQRSRTPASPYGVEWFGTPEDICRVHVALQRGAVGAAAPVRQILAASPGVELDKQQWPYVGAKGGNLPGDLTFSWYAVNRSGQPWVVSFQLSWPRSVGPSAGSWVLSIAQQVFAMVNRES